MAGLVEERRGAICILTIDRPSRANALDAATSAALDQAITRAEGDDGIGAVVLCAAGDRAFCSGMDMKEAAQAGVGQGLIPGRGFAGITERQRSKPLIAVVNGAAVAGGFEIVLACDMVFAAPHAIFGLSEVKRGLFAYAGGIQRLARQLPRATGLAMILTGEPLSAERMHQLGLVTQIFPSDELLERAIGTVETMLSHSWDAIGHALALYDASRAMPEDMALRFGRRFGDATLESSDGGEGVAAFAEGRAAKFRPD